MLNEILCIVRSIQDADLDGFEKKHNQEAGEHGSKCGPSVSKALLYLEEKQNREYS